MLKSIKSVGLALAVVAGLGSQAALAQFLDGPQVRPILNATKANWITVREFDGNDLLYFTHLLSWRCGLSKINYSINNDAVEQEWPLGTCDETSASPNAMADDQQIYGTFQLQSIKSVTVKITYDDGETATESFARKAVLH